MIEQQSILSTVPAVAEIRADADKPTATKLPALAENPALAGRSVVTPEHVKPFPQVRHDLTSRASRRNVGRIRILTCTAEKKAIEDCIRQIKERFLLKENEAKGRPRKMKGLRRL